MAITPVKIGNVTTPPPAKKIDAKLTTQFNAAAKAGSTSPTKPVLPFYTPQKGSFTESRTLDGKAYKVTGNWQINEIQTDPTKVFIRGSVTLTDSAKNIINYVLNSKSSFITKDGKIHYAVGNSNEVHTAKIKSIFKKIEDNVSSALKNVKSNTKYFKDAKGKASPVSLASAKLTLALNEVGEQNLRYGIGLNGAGSAIKAEITSAINDKSLGATVQKAVKIAAAAAGVGTFRELPQTPEASGSRRGPQNPLMLPADISQLSINDDIERTIQALRRQTDGGRRIYMDSADRGSLVSAIVNHYRNTDNFIPVVNAHMEEFIRPGVMTENGLDVEQRVIVRYYTDLYLGYQLRNRRPAPSELRDVARQDMVDVGIDGQMADAALNLIQRSPIFSPEAIDRYVGQLIRFVNNNETEFNYVNPRDMRAATLAAYDRLHGVGTSQSRINDEL